jgi:hypothetical protein
MAYEEVTDFITLENFNAFIHVVHVITVFFFSIKTNSPLEKYIVFLKSSPDGQEKA